MKDKEISPDDRRSSQRIPVEMWVEHSTSREIYFQRSANLSAGGIYLEQTIPLPRGTEVLLSFTLPDEEAPLKVQGEIVNVGESVSELGMGIKFLELPGSVQQRIDSFIQRAIKKIS